MTALLLELAPDLYARLRAEAARQGKPPEGIAQEWLAERLPPAPPTDERGRVRAALRAAGLLAEPSPAMVRLADQATMTLEEARAALDRGGGPPLSELILDMRGPKE